MKRPKKQSMISSKPRNITHKCDSCGLVSKDVSKSIKFKKYLCIECFINQIIITVKE